MTPTTNDKRSDILVVILTAVVIAFLINGLSSVVFADFNVLHPLLMNLIAWPLLVIAVASLYFVLVSSVRRAKLQIEIPLAFNRNLCRFVDLPHCPMSVHARYCFDKLPDAGRLHLAEYDCPELFFRSDFQRFLDHVVQETLLSVVIFERNEHSKDYTRLSRKHFPSGIVENQFLADWLREIKDDRLISAPYFKNIQTFGRNNSFFRIQTKGGTIEFSWIISWCNTPWRSEAFCTSEQATRDDFHDFYVTLTVVRCCKATRIFSGKVQKFVGWSQIIFDRLAQHDWNASQNDRLLYLIHRMREAEKTPGSDSEPGSYTPG